MAEIRMRMGSVRFDWDVIHRLALVNFLAGRAIEDGMPKPTYIPDQRYPSGWLTIHM